MYQTLGDQFFGTGTLELEISQTGNGFLSERAVKMQ
jgi:hypothetical protein